MHIEATEARRPQDRFRQDQAVGGNDHQVRFECRDFRDDLRVPERYRLQYRDLVPERIPLHRAGGQFFAATGGPVGLGQDRYRRAPRFDQGLQRFTREIGRAGKDDSRSVHDGSEMDSGLAGQSIAGSDTRLRRSFSRRLRILCRLASDR
jgi:hypothetical protein